MDRRLFVDRILESENLTDELEDSDAKWLLTWGIDRLDQMLSGISDEETANEKVTALMAVMRKINRIVGWRQQKEPEDLASDLETLGSLFANAFDQDQESSEQACLSAAKQTINLTTNQEALAFLTRWGLRPMARM
jgi:hypothetical protein